MVSIMIYGDVNKYILIHIGTYYIPFSVKGLNEFWGVEELWYFSL